MRYFSTNRVDKPVAFDEAVIKGQPKDKGLYFPSKIPCLEISTRNDLRKKSKSDIAFELIRPYVGGTIPDEALHSICAETVKFQFPLKRLDVRTYALELFHGPTLAFKDVGARFLSRCLSRFALGTNKRTAVIVATSGDTGGAVASAFRGVDNVSVFILYPKGRVSKMQELQLTTNGRSVVAVEIDGSFDDCQALVKAALADREINRRLQLTSANSINIARWLPQQFYYLFAFKYWIAEERPVICVPSGNFGNICAGLLAKASGLPVDTFIAATNANDVVPRYLKTRKFTTRASIATLSNAMDVSNPSNFVRIQELFGYELNDLRNTLIASRISDEATRDAIRDVYQTSGHLLDPHGAVGYAALRNYLEKHRNKRGIFLATAHPAKFDSVEAILGKPVPLPAELSDLTDRPSTRTAIRADLNTLREVVLDTTR